MTYVVGLTGGIGSGKTVVSDHFGALGVPVIDTDVIARLVVEPGRPALHSLVEEFGSEILNSDGSLNRDRMRKIAFADANNKAKLDSITHPAIGTETLAQIRQVTQPYCIVVVPLLAPGSAFEQICQRVLVVTADQASRTERVIKRSALSNKEVERIMKSQIDDATRLELADDVINNDGSIAEAQARVEELHEIYLQLSLAQQD